MTADAGWREGGSGRASAWPAIRTDAVVPTAVGDSTKIRDGHVAAWRDRKRKIDGGRGGMDS
ncbi:hypothetical protein [Ralstonia pseudosolanacearum]|uniref:hypothetical protein n=1 Tax=Ralstonia pseudosolanacearum TaxID=1310165 RepID=UPI001FF91E77|nr:hypothetical protein [Ralstonia pseudosolanacearum]